MAGLRADIPSDVIAGCLEADEFLADTGSSLTGIYLELRLMIDVAWEMAGVPTTGCKGN